MHSSNQ